MENFENSLGVTQEKSIDSSTWIQCEYWIQNWLHYENVPFEN